MIFIKHYLYVCKIRSDINLSRYRSSNERYRDMQLMSLYRMSLYRSVAISFCRGIVRLQTCIDVLNCNDWVPPNNRTGNYGKPDLTAR